MAEEQVQTPQVENVPTKSRKQEAMEVLQQEFMENKQKCWEEVVKVLEKYEMKIEVSTVIRSSGAVSHILDLGPATPAQ